jgi:hypothetical protein
VKTDISEEHVAASLRAEVFGFRNGFGYGGKSQGRLPCDPRGGVKELSPSHWEVVEKQGRL